MSVETHRKDAPARLRVGWVTISDTRNEATDEGGHLGRRLIEAAGHEVARYRLLRDEPEEVSAHVRHLSTEVDAIITSGGTGVSNRDRTYETLSSMIERPIVGFGELFRSLSYAEIGAAAMLSRATAGLFRGVPIFACPGSTDAVRLALEKLILPELGHVVREARR
jgi:molybdenum cofactor biosynthesis protein B